MKTPQQLKSSKAHESKRFTTCFHCNTCLESKDSAEIGGPLFLGNIDTSSILFVTSFTPVHRSGPNYDSMKYLLSLPEGKSSEALKGVMEIEFFASNHRALIASICQLKSGENPFAEGKILVTNSLRCLLDKSSLAEGSLKTCAVWTMQVVSLMKPKGIVFMGVDALTQVLGADMAAGIGLFEIRKHAVFGPVLLLPQSDLAVSRSNLEKSQEMFEQFYEKVTK